MNIHLILNLIKEKSIYVIILILLSIKKYKIWEILHSYNNTTEILLRLISPMVTLFVAFFVYRYTTDNNRRQLLNSLDEKSGWRKKLFELAGSEKIEPKDIHILRASLRFNYKSDPDNYFDVMTKIIIIYCEGVIKEERVNFNLVYDKQIDFEINTLFHNEIVRLFARYLLADHWEKNQLTESSKIKYKKEELVSKEYLKYLVDMYQNNNLVQEDCKEKNSKYDYIKKEKELFEYTIKKFIEISKNATSD